MIGVTWTGSPTREVNVALPHLSTDVLIVSSVGSVEAHTWTVGPSWQDGLLLLGAGLLQVRRQVPVHSRLQIGK